MLGVHQSCKIPPSCCKMVFVAHAHDVLVHVPHGGVVITGEWLALLPVTVTVLAGPILQVRGVTLENKGTHQIEAAFTFPGVAEAAAVEFFPLAGVLDGCEVCVWGVHSFTSAVLRSYSP